MSVIGKKPFVNKIVDACSKEQTQQIINLMNNLGNPTLVALYGYDNLIGPANIGVSYVTLKMNQLLAQIVNGILVYIDDTHCGFFGITSNSDNIDEFEIDPVNKTYNKIRENLTVEELRQVCGDRLVEVGGNITVQADDIDSGSATEGQTLVANGQGGAVWGDAGGSSPTLYELEGDVDVGELDSDFVDNLKVGDIIASPHLAWIVSEKRLDEGAEVVALTLSSGEAVETIYYVLEDGEWVYDQTMDQVVKTTKMYLHRISTSLQGGGDAYCEIYSADLIPYTAETLKTLIGNNKEISAHNSWTDQTLVTAINGFIVLSSKLHAKGIRYNGTTSTFAVYVSGEITSITDTVTEL